MTFDELLSELEKKQFNDGGTSNQVKLIDAIKSEFELISAKIKVGEPIAKLRDRTIVASRVAATVGVNSSYVTERNTPEIYSLIKKSNLKLCSLYEYTMLEKHGAGSKSKRKDDLVEENKALKEKLKRMEESSIREQIQSVIDAKFHQLIKVNEQALFKLTVKLQQALQEKADLVEQLRKLERLIAVRSVEGQQMKSKSPKRKISNINTRFGKDS